MATGTPLSTSNFERRLSNLPPVSGHAGKARVALTPLALRASVLPDSLEFPWGRTGGGRDVGRNWPAKRAARLIPHPASD
jgi:hypothetical protein